MAAKQTTIAWSDRTINPIHMKDGGHWCRKISKGCDRCYAERHNLSYRYEQAASRRRYKGQPPLGLVYDRKLVDLIERARGSHKWFVCSMTDLFGEWVPRNFQFYVLDTIRRSPNQSVQLLTKRPKVMRQAIGEWLKERDLKKLPANCWIGVSVESTYYRSRIRELLQIPGGLKWISCEPLLSALNIGSLIPRLDWVVIGGESGIGARPCAIAWISRLISQCKSANVPVFVNQIGHYPVVLKGRAFERVQGISDPKGRNPIEWPPHLRVFEMPTQKVVLPPLQQSIY